MYLQLKYKKHEVLWKGNNYDEIQQERLL